MSEVKSRFESGHEISKEERREERKQEIQNIRSRLFMGKQAKIKEMYQQAVLDSEQGKIEWNLEGSGSSKYLNGQKKHKFFLFITRNSLPALFKDRFHTNIA